MFLALGSRRNLADTGKNPQLFVKNYFKNPSIESKIICSKML